MFIYVLITVVLYDSIATFSYFSWPVL